LTESADTPDSDREGAVTGGGTGTAQGVSLDLGNGSKFTFSNNRWVGKKLTFVQVAEQLEQFLDHPVVDQTGLMRRYDITLELTPDDYQAMRIRGSVNAGFPVSPQLQQRADAAGLDSLYEGFEKLGLRLDIKKLAQPVIEVDSALAAPTEN
jgi:uncharacterized protein (TIGR03435 family)